MKPRVVITGIGMLTPLAIGTEATWNSLVAGLSGIRSITRFDPSGFSCRIAGELKGFDPLDFMPVRDAHRTDPFIQYALAAALLAVGDAGVAEGTGFSSRFSGPAALRTGVLVGSGRGGVTTAEKNMELLLARGPRAVSPFSAPMTLVNMAAGYIGMVLGVRGPCLDVSTACATGTHAIGEAMKIIQRGDADVMIAGGAEASLTRLVLAGFCQAKALSLRNDQPEKASRPFDRDRDGFILAEGAGVLILEELGHAERRNARIYAELTGYGMSCDAYHYTRPDETGDGPARAMSAALQDAGIKPAEVDYVNAHGTSTRTNDRVETAALKQAFGDHAARLLISSSKSMLGHMLGAAGAVEAAITVLAVRHGIVPPTINLETPDPACNLNYVPNYSQKKSIRNALSNSLGFGGSNGALVFKQYQPA